MDEELLENCYPRICRAVAETPWAILPTMLATIVDLLQFRAGGGRLSREEIQARIGAAPTSRGAGNARAGSVAVVPLHGVIMQRADMFDEISGAVSLERTRMRLDRALADPDVGTVLLHIDSPGGGVFGVPEFADYLMSLRGGEKRIVASASSMAASAAYWIGTAADEFVVTPSGVVGSIGVYSAHQNLAGMLEQLGVEMTLISAGKYKTEGHPFGPLDEEARAAMQADVDDYYEQFLKAVAAGRGKTSAQVKANFGEGRTVLAQAALRAGMVDRVEPIDKTLARLRGAKSRKPSTTGERRSRVGTSLRRRIAFG